MQIGLQSAEVVMLIMSEKGLNALMSDQFKIGADAGVTVVTIGSNAEIATTSAARADVIVWASSSGAYAGITVNGSIVKPRESWNESYYGHPATTRQIISNPVGLNREAIELRRDLRSVS
ncbi:MAG: lipid-binding SYLF domain-containing protein [Rhodospirillales bacterium]